MAFLEVILKDAAAEASNGIFGSSNSLVEGARYGTGDMQGEGYSDTKRAKTGQGHPDQAGRYPHNDPYSRHQQGQSNGQSNGLMSRRSSLGFGQSPNQGYKGDSNRNGTASASDLIRRVSSHELVSHAKHQAHQAHNGGYDADVMDTAVRVHKFAKVTRGTLYLYMSLYMKTH